MVCTLSNPLFFYCFHLAGPSAPTGLTATSITDSSVSLTWTAPASNGGRNDGIVYVILYKLSTDQVFVEYPPTSTINETSVTISELLPNTSYTFAVVAENKVTNELPDVFTLANATTRTSSEVIVTTNASGKLHPHAVFIYVCIHQMEYTN